MSDQERSRPVSGAEPAARAHTYASVTEHISAMVLQRGTKRGWILGFAFAFLLVMVMLWAITRLLVYGVGLWGINIPTGWGFAIINFVWWIGIGHAGTLISAILLLFRQKWRTSINRFAEAMTLFAVACAGIFPLLHLGRPWLFYWLVPYPNTMNLWPQFRSPLVWDIFAVGTYFTVSLMFWYVGLIPDLATMRDRAKRRFVQVIYGIMAMGWRGSARHWKRYEMAYLLLAGLATPLVISVHSVVGLDFAVATLPGWHSTIFPPYFVAGAIYSGFAMVLVISIPLRRFYNLGDLVTMKHLDNMAKIMLATGLMVGYGYVIEFFMAWYSGNVYERFMAWNRMFGPYAPYFWALIGCNIVAIQPLWLRKVRRNVVGLFVISIIVLIGMWLERFIIVVTSLHRDFLPSSWGYYVPTVDDWALFIGTLGFFTALLFLFIRLLPSVSISEMRELIHEEPQDVEEPPAEEEKTPDLPQERRGHSGEPWGVMGSYARPEPLLEAVKIARAEGYRRLSAYTPFPVRGVSSALGFTRTRMPLLVLIGALAGATTGFVMQYYAFAVDYPLNIGGKPNNSWPAWIPITFELAVLFASITAVVGMLALNRLPKPYHPVFNVPEFSRATTDRFFLCIERRDERFDMQRARSLLERTGALTIREVDP